jgi:hypothetical protein
MFRRRRVRTAHTGFDVWDSTSSAPVGRLEELRDGWLLLASSAGDAEPIGYLPAGAVQFVDVKARRIVLRPGVDTSHVLDPNVPLESRAERVADAVANVGLCGFCSREEGTFLDPR